MPDAYLNKKIFLTDKDFEELFGPTIARLVKIMNKAAVDVCPPCNGYCCKNINCVFYSEYFSTCPIYDRRPRNAVIISVMKCSSLPR